MLNVQQIVQEAFNFESMPRLFYAISIVCVSLISCSRNTIGLFDISANSENVEYIDGFEYVKCSTENFDIQVAFVEEVADILVFRCIVENYSKDSVTISSQDFELSFYNRDDDQIGTTIPRIDRESRIAFLENERESIGESKKNRTIGGAIFASLEAIAIAISPGGNVGGAILYAAESSAYIADERNRFKLAELSIEDEIRYIEDWVLDEAVVGAYSDEEFDLLYERLFQDGDLIFTVDINGEYCEAEFYQKLE